MNTDFFPLRRKNLDSLNILHPADLLIRVICVSVFPKNNLQSRSEFLTGEDLAVYHFSFQLPTQD